MREHHDSELFWSWDCARARRWVYSHMVDFITADNHALMAKRSKVIESLTLHLADPFIITDETWGTGASAEAATTAWEDRFGRAAPRAKPETEHAAP